MFVGFWLDYIANYLGALANAWVVMTILTLIINPLTKFKKSKGSVYGIAYPCYLLLLLLLSLLAEFFYYTIHYFTAGATIWGIYAFRDRKSKSTVCPYCKEKIKNGAIICKHCRSNLSVKQTNLHA